MQFDDFFCHKDIGTKAFFTMATLFTQELTVPYLQQRRPIFFGLLEFHSNLSMSRPRQLSMVNPEQALVLMLKGLRIFYLVILVLYHQLKELQNLLAGSTNLET